MAEPPIIENLEEQIESYFNGVKVLSYKKEFLTKPGDNYGSVIIRITAKTQENQKEPQELNLVAKCCPMNDLFWDFFKCDKTFVRESSIYRSIAPALRNFQQEVGVLESEVIDVFAKCYGTRLSLNPDAKLADRNALILLENLGLKGYSLGDRKKGLDYATTLVVLDNLAQFHAVPIALRYSKPEVFESQVRPTMTRFDIDAGDFDVSFESIIINDLCQSPGVIKHEIDKIPEMQKANRVYMSSKDPCENTIWTTIAHYDFWVNNIMINCDEKKVPKKIKILDFQTSQYESLAHDVIFFIGTSIESQLTEEFLHEFLHFYYDRFIASLKLSKQDTKAYTYEKFTQEINRLAPIQLPHILGMLRILFLNNKSETFADLSLEHIEDDSCLDPGYYKKLEFVIRLYKNASWL